MSGTLDPNSQPALNRPIALTKFAWFVYTVHINSYKRGCPWEGKSQASIIITCMTWESRAVWGTQANGRGRPQVWAFICLVFCKDCEADWLVRDATLVRLLFKHVLSPAEGPSTAHALPSDWTWVGHSTIPIHVTHCQAHSRCLVNICCVIPTCQAVC